MKELKFALVLSLALFTRSKGSQEEGLKRSVALFKAKHGEVSPERRGMIRSKAMDNIAKAYKEVMQIKVDEEIQIRLRPEKKLPKK